MREQPLQAAVRRLRELAEGKQDAEASDAELLRRFTLERDESAFTVLVRRHGPMVREVCRRLLGQMPDVEDASQVVFLVLARKAGSIRRSQSLAGWLYGIAYRTALRARRDAMRRKRREGKSSPRKPDDPASEAIRRELCEVIDAELYRLPEAHRAALVLCYLEGCTRDEAARRLGQSLRTLDRRLQCGRELLRLRLVQRGVTLSAALLTLGLSQNLTNAGILAGWKMVPHELSAEVLTLMKGVLRNMLWTRIQIVAASLLVLALMGTATGFLTFRAMARDTAEPSQPVSPEEPARAAVPAKSMPEPDVYALLLIEDGEPRLLPAPRLAVAAEGDPSVYRRTQAVLLKSRAHLRSARKRKEIKSLPIVKKQTDPERWLARNIETIFLDNTGVMRVSFGEGKPQERAVIINAVVEVYMDETVYMERRRKEIHVTELEKAVDGSRQRLREKWRAIGDKFKSAETKAQSSHRVSEFENLALLRKELLRVRLERTGMLARLKYRKNKEREGDKAMLAKWEEAESALEAQEKLLEKDITSLQKRIKELVRIEVDNRDSLDAFRYEIATNEKFSTDLANQLNASKIELSARPRVRILQNAEAPTKEK